MAEPVPEYLKSLQNLLDKKPVASTAATDLSLSSIGFGNIFNQKRDPSKLGVMLVSTHVHQFTGYSKVSYGILQELSKQPWLQVTHFGFQRFHEVGVEYRPYPSNVQVIDAASLEKPIQQGFGYALLPEVIRKQQPAVVIVYNDLYVGSSSSSGSSFDLLAFINSFFISSRSTTIFLCSVNCKVFIETISAELDEGLVLASVVAFSSLSFSPTSNAYSDFPI